MNDEGQSRSRLYNERRKDDGEKLWQNLKIDFHLEAFKFPDNKIYGIIDITPESSRKLIQKLVLVVNKTNRIEFDPYYTNISASGFNINRKHPSAYIQAIPNDTKWEREPKTSKICYFYFTGEVFALSPTISFDWPSKGKNSKPNLLIKWYHIGDKNAHRYILYLDDLEIQNIRQKSIDDAFHISICGFECGEKHTFQLVARLSNGKETYRSDLMEFIVPDKTTADNDSTEFITVSNEPPPPDLPIGIATDGDKTEEDFNQLLEQNDDNEKCTYCNHSPHDTFPGIEHYFSNMLSILPSSSNKDDRIISSKKNEEESDDDDDDVIMSNNQK